MPVKFDKILGELREEDEGVSVGRVAFEKLTPEQVAQLKGPKGDAGAQGPRGEQGEPGQQGDPGRDGAPGAPGAPGENGKDGSDGRPGVTFTPAVSEDGQLSWTNDGGLDNPPPVTIRGAKGERGDAGPRGEQGLPGETGETGQPGKDGQPGRDGAAAGFADPAVSVEMVDSGAPASATVTASGNDTEKLFEFAFKIPKAEPGTAGPAGAPGERGETGEAGPANELTVDEVVTGEPGTAALVEITGEAPHQTIRFTIPRGEKGETGPAGEAGAPGRDGVLIQPEWHIIDEPVDGAITLDVANGELQKTYIGSECTITPPDLDAEHPTLLLQFSVDEPPPKVIIRNSSTAKETYYLKGKGTFQLGWFWDGDGTRRYPIVDITRATEG